MLKRLTAFVALVVAAAAWNASADRNDESGVRDFISRWNKAYVSLDAKSLAALETADFQLVDRFGHWIRSEGPEFNRQLWARTFNEIYHGKPGPARTIESVRFLAPQVAIVQARANHAAGVILDDGTRIPPFWEIDTYTLIRTKTGWLVALLNIHNQIDPAAERTGEHVPQASSAGGTGR